MLLGLAILLAVLWVLGFAAFHVTTGAIHILIVLAIAVAIAHFVTGGRGRPIAAP